MNEHSIIDIQRPSSQLGLLTIYMPLPTNLAVLVAEVPVSEKYTTTSVGLQGSHKLGKTKHP